MYGIMWRINFSAGDKGKINSDENFSIQIQEVDLNLVDFREPLIGED